LGQLEYMRVPSPAASTMARQVRSAVKHKAHRRPAILIMDGIDWEKVGERSYLAAALV
jgi:hypothetical protein